MSDYLSNRQMRAIDALMSGRNVAGAAEAAGVSVRTLRRWRDSPLFTAELQARGGEALEDTARQLSAAMRAAPATIAAIMTDGKLPAGVRLAAAKTALENGMRLIELTDLMQRLEALEKHANIETA